MLIPQIPEVNRKPQAGAGRGALSEGSPRASAILSWRYRFVLLYAFPGRAWTREFGCCPA
jgi:hypothetical protein